MKRKQGKSIEQRKEKAPAERRYPVLVATALGMLILALCAGCLALLQMRRYEEGILDVCAVQQDGYVQLVLEQINLQGGQGSEEDITRILGTLDASSNKYWTFSKDQSMLFVKDVLETNKYKGFTTKTYYVSDSARAFLDSIQTNRVTHGNIMIEDKEYVVSGTAFVYGGDTYQLCLLTNRDVLLDNNQFLGAKIELGIIAAVLLFLLVIIPMAYAIWIRKLQRASAESEEAVRTLNENLSRMNKLLSEQDLHDTRSNIWKQEALPEFLKKIRDRGATPSTLVKVKCASAEASEELLQRAASVLDKTVLRFEMEDSNLAFLFVQRDMDPAVNQLLPLLTQETTLEDLILLAGGASAYQRAGRITGQTEGLVSIGH